MGGSDEYKNLIMVKPIVHKLIHATKMETIRKYLGEYKFNKSMLTEIDKYRVKAGNSKIEDLISKYLVA